jgi:hypothetical protein
MSELIQLLTEMLSKTEQLAKERGVWVEPDSELKGIVLDDKAQYRVHTGQALVIGRRKVEEIIAALSAKEDPLRWTTGKPIMEGWYWYRASPKDRAFPIQLLDDGDGLLYTVISMGLDATIENMEGEFAGPIPQPQQIPT